MLEAMGPRVKQVFKSACVDPSLIATENEMEFLTRIVGYGFKVFFLGVERDSAEMAEKIGVKLLGKPRSQEQLDWERRAIKKMIQTDLPALSFCLSGDERFRVVLSAIVTPFETEESLLGLLRTLKNFENMENKYVEVEITLQSLFPLPGTKLRKDLIRQGLVLDPENFLDFGIAFCNWNPSLGKAAQFIDELALYRSIIFQTIKQPLVGPPRGEQTRIGRFIEMAEEVFSGRVLPFSAEEKLSLWNCGFHL
jgi:hypothetical protein